MNTPVHETPPSREREIELPPNPANSDPLSTMLVKFPVRTVQGVVKSEVVMVAVEVPDATHVEKKLEYKTVVKVPVELDVEAVQFTPSVE